jgi:hypothetical protein
MSSNNDETKYYQEWKGFLQQSTRLDVRMAAITAVLEHPQDVPEDLWSEGVLPLIHLVEDEDDEDDSMTTVLLHNQITFKALQSLQYKIETSLQHPEWVNRLWTRLTDLTLSTPPRHRQQQQPIWRQCVNAACALLANLSREEAGAIALVGTTLPEEAVYRHHYHHHPDAEQKNESTARVKPTLELLLSRFLSLQYLDGTMTTNSNDDASSNNENAADPYQHMAHVLMNITQVDLGRRFLLQLHHAKDHTSTSVLQQLLPQLQSPNAIRRCGMAGMCRNICLAESDSVDWLLHTCKIVTPLLWPLAGPEELDVDEKQGLDPQLWLLTGPDKQREPVSTTRLYLVEAILALLKQSRAARHVLRLQRVYVILKYADMVEEDELVSEQIYECVNYLRGDEEGLGEGSSDRAVAMAYPDLQKEMAAVQVDYDQVD